MLSKNKIKFIKSLQQKKNRIHSNIFVVEGRKSVLSLLNSVFEVKEVYCSANAIEKTPELKNLSPIVVDELLIEKASGLKSNREAIAVVKQKESEEIDWQKNILYLDGISDPGNLGTIVRTAEWFGIEQIICSEECVEFYNPKVIQSTMGAFASKTPITRGVLPFLEEKPINVPLYLTNFEGESPKKLAGITSGVVVLGSESHGVSEIWEKSDYFGGKGMQRLKILFENGFGNFN